ncbi:ATP-dependent DNA ligase [Paenibacillus rhizosphaerae]|uniref:ATP-dependent DNA ligase n=1 Tax=Paenibacillus rhizosphaerae TaxID=297318 RepID=A0A839TG13_9BACL|nr:ATP-dependent DNA ligase [Paenibacillus rhizosphaerae]
MGMVVYQREDCFITGYSKKEVAWTLGVLRNGQIAPAGTLKYGLTDPVRKRAFPIILKTKVSENKNYVFVQPDIQIRVRFRHWTDEGYLRLPVFEEFIQI